MASHQVEGGNHNQWTVWEHETAARQAATAAERLSWLPVWQNIKDEATNPLNYVSGNAVDHFHKYELDFKLAAGLNLNALRGGIEWSRVNPAEGVFVPEAIEHYSRYFNSMKQAGLEPMVNLFHWTLPVWLAEKGGFAKSSNMKYWRDFVHTIVQNMDFSSVKYVFTINEANTYAGMSYFLKEFPPGENNFWRNVWVYYQMSRAHRVAYKIIKKRYPHIQVGFAHQYNKVISRDTLGKLFAWQQLWFWDWGWIKLCRKFDFVGINYYFADYRSGKKINFDINHETPRNDLGWHMEPNGISWVLKDVARRFKGKPIIITENGVADMDDKYRQWWIEETIRSMQRSIKAGIPLIGYLHWSLLDNFEWQLGWFPKFGLIAVDRKTMKRTVKKSAKAWGSWLKPTK